MDLQLYHDSVDRITAMMYPPVVTQIVVGAILVAVGVVILAVGHHRYRQKQKK